MMNTNDIRWKQRFNNFDSSIKKLQLALALDNPSIIEKAGLIQFFEISFELSWNVIKDYLEEQGFIDIKSPRDCIKKAFEIGLILNGHTWLEALKNRNLTSHTYDEEMVNQVVQEIRNSYYPLLQDLHIVFQNKL